MSSHTHLADGGTCTSATKFTVFIQELQIHFRCIWGPDVCSGTKCVQWEIKTTEADALLFVGCQEFSERERSTAIVLRHKDESSPK